MGTADIETEILIAGGGMVGLTLAVALARAEVAVVVVDREPPRARTDTAFDGRSSAIAHGSRRILEGIGLWAAMAQEAEPILDIRVSDGRIGRPASSLFLHFDHRAVGAPFGHIVENTAIRRALAEAVAGCAGLCYLAPMDLAGAERDGTRVLACLADGRRVRARLLVAADGRDSPLREGAGIRTARWSYPQTAIVATVGHELPHQGVAHEHFLPAGPFAMLPMTGRRSSIVWTERAALAPAMMALDPDAFAAEIERRFGGSLGRLHLIGRRWSYPLAFIHAARYADTRLALVGDAAHAIHPIAGQGLNLGLRDVAALAEAVVDAVRLGLDPGGSAVLAEYQGRRRSDSLAVAAVTDALNRLFSNDVAPVRLVRDLGLALVDRLPPVKRFFMRTAMDGQGDLPRLAQGEAL
jgi:2-octaprenyl-6-methoxyphenol hydroxylase